MSFVTPALMLDHILMMKHVSFQKIISKSHCKNVTCAESEYGNTLRCFSIAYEDDEVNYEVRDCMWRTKSHSFHGSNTQEEMEYKSLSEIYRLYVHEGERADKYLAGYHCDEPNCNDRPPVSPAETATTIAMIMMMLAAVGMLTVIVVIIFHLIMWHCEKVHKVNPKELPYEIVR